MRNLACTVVIAVLAAGCSFNSSRPVEDWPAMRIVEHKVPDAEMRERCGRAAGAGMRAIACAQFNFRESRCDIWYGSLGLLRPIVVAHERGHCRGHDHVGSDGMARELKSYRETGG